MANQQQWAASRAINHQTNALRIVDELSQERTLARNQEYAARLHRVRREIVEANAQTCLAFFPTDTMTDLIPVA